MNLMDKKGRAWLEISLNDIVWNYKQLMTIVPDDCHIMAIVKADAYGHGAVEVSKILASEGCKYFAVASLDEGIALRSEGIEEPIIVLGYTMPQDAFLLEHYHITQAIADEAHARALAESGYKIKAHLAVDTGMNRLGISYKDIDAVLRVLSLKNLFIEGVFSHFSVADSTNESDVDFTRKQIASFQGLKKRIEEAGYHNLKFHMQSSYAMMFYRMEGMSYCRPGIALYGCSSNHSKEIFPIALKPALQLKCRIGCIRKVSAGDFVSYGRTYEAKEDRIVAVAAIGYADGLPRNIQGNGYGIVHGQRIKMIGRVCMDQTMFDVTDMKDVKEGDIITLIGKDGTEEISAVEMAQNARTITNELLSRLGSRLVKNYED